jgi:hypothetical protein
MRSFWATPYYPTDIHPALNNFAEECCAVLARLLAYLGTLALLILAGIHLWRQLPTGEASEQAAKAGWSQALRSHPAFAVSQIDIHDKSETYEIFRHPEGTANRAKSRLRSWKSTVPEGNSTRRTRLSPRSSHERSLRAVVNSKPPG